MVGFQRQLHCYQTFRGINFFFDAESDYGMEVMGIPVRHQLPVRGDGIRAYNLNDGTLIATIALPGTFANGMASMEPTGYG